MKVLFVRSGNNGDDIISTNQGYSLIKEGIEVIYFDVVGKGLVGYLSNIIKLRTFIKKRNPDLIHAHYSFCGIVSVLSLTNKPIITSLMGSDIKADRSFRRVLLFFNRFFWKRCIVKSRELKDSIGINNALVIPNGVDFEVFYPLDKIEARRKLNWPLSKKIILFASDPTRKEKNVKLVYEALDLLDFPHELKTLSKVNHSDMVYYYNAADIVLLTSLWEGSPNVIKEAAACNRPIVATNVGDIKKNIGMVEGCFITKHDSKEIADKIKSAIKFNSTNSRDKIRHLNAKAISKELLLVYNEILTCSND